jgi:hypothetical protein
MNPNWGAAEKKKPLILQALPQRPNLPWPIASWSGEWASKSLHVHLGGPPRHPFTLLGGPLLGGLAPTFATFGPKPKWRPKCHPTPSDAT